jgi:hypothetical protein
VWLREVRGRPGAPTRSEARIRGQVVTGKDEDAIAAAIVDIAARK